MALISRAVISVFVLRQRRVDRGDDDVERGEAVVGQIHAAVRQDVALDAGEHGRARRSGR